MKPTYQDIKAAAQYRWQEIHAAIGIDPRYLKNKHQPCPACGGKDRFRYDDKDGNGTFICSHYHNGAGDGFGLVMHYLNCGFDEALRAVAGVLNMGGANPWQIPPTRPQTQPRPEKDQIGKLAALWNGAEMITADSPAVQYLKSRGLDMAQLPENVRFLREADYWATGEDKPLFIGRFPCMVCAIRDTDGELQGLHMTYFQTTYDKPCGEDGLHAPHYQKLAIKHPETGETLPAKKMRARFSGSLKGAAVHLAAPDKQGRLIVAEGIESALAASALFGLPAAAALSAHGMAVFEWPPETRELFIAADNDGNGTGIQAAEKLARRALLAGIKANIWQPEQTDTDALDELNRRQTKGETS